MSNITTQTDTPLWKLGRNGNIQFLASWKRLEREQPDLYKLIERREGSQCVDAEYEYHVGVSKFGLWLSRKAISLETLKTIANNSKEQAPKKIAIPDMIKDIEKPTEILSNGHNQFLRRR